MIQNSQTYQNKNITAAKKPAHTFHGTPVFFAIASIRFIVPRNLTLVISNPSFILSANALLSRISSPIALVRSFSIRTLALIAPTWSSFWLSSSSSTASLYCPRLFGVAERKESGCDW